MKRVLIPISGNKSEESAIKQVIDRYKTHPVIIYLLNVQVPLSKYVTRFISQKQVQEFHEESGMQALKPIMDELDAAGIPHRSQIIVGHKAESIVQFAQDFQFSQIIVLKPNNASDMFGLGSLGSQIRHLLGADGHCQISEVY